LSGRKRTLLRLRRVNLRSWWCGASRYFPSCGGVVMRRWSRGRMPSRAAALTYWCLTTPSRCWGPKLFITESSTQGSALIYGFRFIWVLPLGLDIFQHFYTDKFLLSCPSCQGFLVNLDLNLIWLTCFSSGNILSYILVVELEKQLVLA